MWLIRLLYPRNAAIHPGEILMVNPTSELGTRLTTWFQRKTSINSVRRISAFSAALSSDIGLKRDENQDRVAIARGRDGAGRPYILAALSDGIGGMKDGAGAAAETLGQLITSFFDATRVNDSPDAWLRHAVQSANTAIFNRLGGRGGATLSVLLMTAGGKISLLNVGDSRIYRFAGGKLSQLTVDDTMAGQLGHKIEADMGSNLLQFIGIGKDLEATVVPVDGIEQDDTLLLTSDGIHFMDQAWLAELIYNANDPGVALRRLTETAKWCGGHDNATAAMLSPIQAIREPFAQDNVDALDIWDPFGELQLILPRARAPSVGPVASRGDTDSAALAAVVEPLMAPPPPEPTGAKRAQTKKKRERKPKSQIRRSDENRGQSGGEKPETPQLKIEYPHKAN